MLKIKFSHEYPKLHGQTTARLLDVELTSRAVLDHAFVDYDTIHGTGTYKLSGGLLLVLTFSGNLRIPFTTIRRATGQKETWYRSKIGHVFHVVIEQEEPTNQIAIPLEELPEEAV